MAAHAQIAGIQFGLQSDAVRLEQGRVIVRSYELFSGTVPVDGGIYDPRMGTTDMHYTCLTCGRQRKTCPGHPGILPLRSPIIVPVAISETRRWLRVICLVCGAPMMDPFAPRLKQVPDAKRLAAAANIDTANRPCPRCRSVHPKVVKVAQDHFSFELEYTVNGRTVVRPLFPHQIFTILSRISDATVRAMGRKPEAAAPSMLVAWVLQVPPVTIRPGVRMAYGGSGSQPTSYHDLNSLLQYLVKGNLALPTEMPGRGVPVPERLALDLNNLQQLAFDLMQGSSATSATRQKRGGKRGLVVGGRPSLSIMQRFPRKIGRIRKNLFGRRVWDIARNTISGNNHLAIDEVGMPENVARGLQVAETVQQCNLGYLTPFFLNGKRQYPGSTRVWKAATNSVHDVEGLRSDFRLEVGDVLYRDVVSGDVAFFNRQPSLERSALGVHKVVVLRGSRGAAIAAETGIAGPAVSKTFQMNVMACDWYNADFDGDEMTMWVLSQAAVRAEAETLASVRNGFISTKSSGPVNGMVQDSTVGSFLMTRESVRMNKLHAMSLFQDTRMKPPDFSRLGPADLLSGWDVVSMLLEPFPISYQRPPTWYSKAAVPYLKYVPEETLTVIERGRMLGGVLDKKAVGAGATGGIFHRISRQFGPAVTLKVIFALQQMAVTFAGQRGFTVSVSDMILPQDKLQEVHDIIAGMMRESEEINQQLMLGQIIPPLGMTTHAFYERLQMAALSAPDTILGPILNWVNPDTNGFHQMVATGSKGGVPNQINVMAMVGQVTINTRRIEPGSNGRTQAYFPRGDMSAASSGFVPNGYVNGLTASQHFFGAMNGRNDLTSKALATASTGYANRKSIMGLQSCITDVLRFVMANGNSGVAQFIYGDDGMDARQVEPVKFRTVELSNQALAEQFGIAGNSSPWHVKEMEQIVADRDMFRKTFLAVENVNFNHAFTSTVPMAVNVRAVAQASFGAAKDTAPPEGPVLAAMSKMVQGFCDNMPYMLLNKTQERKRAKVPWHMTAATCLLQMLVRAELCGRRLLDMGATPSTLQLALDTIRVQYHRSLVCSGEAVGVLASQAVSEPLTQYMLDSHHRSVAGGTNKSGIVRPQEIFAAKTVKQEASSEMILRVLKSPKDRHNPPTAETYEDQLTNDRGVLQEMANSIKLLTLGQLLFGWQLLYEQFGETDASKVYPGFAKDSSWIEEYLKYNPLLKPPSDLSNWCVRFELSRMNLVMKSISLETVIQRLRSAYAFAFVVHSPESSDSIVIRAYLRAGAFKRSSTTRPLDEKKMARAAIQLMTSRALRGIPGIRDATVVKIVRHVVSTRPEDRGAVVRDKGALAIRTVGTNLHGVLTHSRIDPYTLVSSSIGDTLRLYGIEAARTKIINAIRDVMGNGCPNLRHLQIYADQMTRTGRHTSLEKGGINQREHSNVFLRAGMSAPAAVFADAAFEGIYNPVYGMATPLVLGSVPRVGSTYNTFVVDDAFVAANRMSVTRVMDML